MSFEMNIFMAIYNEHKERTGHSDYNRIMQICLVCSFLKEAEKDLREGDRPAIKHTGRIVDNVTQESDDIPKQDGE